MDTSFADSEAWLPQEMSNDPIAVPEFPVEANSKSSMEQPILPAARQSLVRTFFGGSGDCGHDVLQGTQVAQRVAENVEPAVYTKLQVYQLPPTPNFCILPLKELEREVSQFKSINEQNQKTKDALDRDLYAFRAEKVRFEKWKNEEMERMKMEHQQELKRLQKLKTVEKYQKANEILPNKK